MGKRYFCDYCDKSFPDNAQNRKKHIDGIQHQKEVKTHYYNFKDPEEILREETNKKPCRILRQDGHCNFHPICKFSHLTPQWERELRNQIDLKHQKGTAMKLEESKAKEAPTDNPTLDGWMSRWDKFQGKSKGQETQLSRDGGFIFQLPPELRDRTDLPPSMVPPTLRDLAKMQDSDWG